MTNPTSDQLNDREGRQLVNAIHVRKAVQDAVIDAMIEHGPDGHIDGYQQITDAALKAAAPFFKPQQVTTAKELDALGRSAAIMEPDGTVWVNDGQTEDPWASFAEDPFGGPIWTGSSSITLPVTVLHVGAAK